MKIAVVSIIGVIILAAIVAMLWISTSNGEIRCRNRLENQQKVCKAVYDETWKVIAQKAQVTDSYKEAFREIFPALMEGRYGNEKGGALMKFVNEANPTFDVSLYKDLSSAIEAKRAVFTREQKTLLDLKREHDDMRMTFPSSLVVGARPEFNVVIITSSRTETAYETGKDDDVNVFQR
jgi:hypothetical protein